ncbi:hypothetical protein [Flavobacterium sp.]|uniref:hypothetical protein n=1 Tax=Flavobacterium sp. TaxID=239 RepID=UPI003267D01D
MKRIILILCLSSILNSCGFNLEEDGYNFDNFKETPLWELAQAVRADDENEVKQILKDSKLEVDLKDPEYFQTLLALSIQNHKRKAFLALLNAGANSNELLGNPQDATPFIYAIWNVDNCDLFYVENMLKHGANPNLEIKNPKPGYYFQNTFPLLVAIGLNDNNGNDCLNLIRLLVENGADINVCFKQPESDLCEGVIAESLTANSMETLKYFVVEKKITIPDTVTIYGGIDKSTQEVYGLKEVLSSEKFEYKDFESDGIKYDRSKQRKIRDEILEYLNKTKK